MRDERKAQGAKNAGKFSGYWLGVIALMSCGASQKLAVENASDSSPPAVAAPETTPALPALQPVAIPENLVAWASLPTPGKTLDRAIAWAGLDIPWRPLLGALSGPLGVILPIVDWNAPIDAAIALDPEAKNRPRFFLAASIGLTSVQAALEAFRAQEIPTEFVMPGVHAVHLTSRYECFISRAVGPAEARMVCSDSNSSLRQLHPYLTRGEKPRPTSGKALSAEALFPFAWQQFSDKAAVLQRALPLLLGEIATGDSGIDSAMRKAAGPLSAELVTTLSELSRFHLDLQFSPSAQALRLEVGVQLAEGKSWSSAMLNSAAQSVEPAPQSFWRLPKDVSQAMYRHGNSPPEQERAVVGFRQLLEAGLVFLQASPPVQKNWLDAFQAIALLPGASVIARGPLPAGEVEANRDTQEANELGYWLITAEQDEHRVFEQFIKACLALYTDSSLRKYTKNQFNIEATNLPVVVQRKGTGQLAGAQVFELSLPGTPPVQLILGRRGNASIVGVSTSPGLLVDKLAPLLSAANSPAPSLAERTDLQSLRDTPATSAGFISLAGLPGPLVDASSKAARAVQQLPGEIRDLALPIIYRAKKADSLVDGSIRIDFPRPLIRAVGSALSPQ